MTKKKNTDETCLEAFDEFVKQYNIGLANLEKVGSAFIVFGYANYIQAANLDILEVLEKNNTGVLPSEIFYNGEKYVLIGLVVLLIVVVQRIKIKNLVNIVKGENSDLRPLILIKDSYILSVYANMLRVQGLYEVFIQEKGGETTIE